jgi:hypothetical protein
VGSSWYTSLSVLIGTGIIDPSVGLRNAPALRSALRWLMSLLRTGRDWAAILG